MQFCDVQDIVVCGHYGIEFQVLKPGKSLQVAQDGWISSIHFLDLVHKVRPQDAIDPCTQLKPPIAIDGDVLRFGPFVPDVLPHASAAGFDPFHKSSLFPRPVRPNAQANA
jgi:hypothetical protein